MAWRIKIRDAVEDLGGAVTGTALSAIAELLSHSLTSSPSDIYSSTTDAEVLLLPWLSPLIPDRHPRYTSQLLLLLTSKIYNAHHKAGNSDEGAEAHHERMKLPRPCRSGGGPSLLLTAPLLLLLLLL